MELVKGNRQITILLLERDVMSKIKNIIKKIYKKIEEFALSSYFPHQERLTKEEVKEILKYIEKN